jgi:hypothetical protein
MYSALQLMTHFFRQLLLYITFEVVEPLWAAFEAKLQGSASLDEVRLVAAVTRHYLVHDESFRAAWRGYMP